MRALTDRDVCWNHAPELAAQRAEARKRGGHRRKRGTGEDAPARLELRTTEAIQRLVERATRDALALDSGVERCRVLLQAAEKAAKLLEVGSMEERLAALETRLAMMTNNTTRRIG